jgi:hypothetical protein
VCTSFESPPAPTPATTPLNPAALKVRNFVLYSHRRIVDDLALRQGVYLDTVLDAFPSCPDRQQKMSWLRQLVVDAPDTGDFAERIVLQLQRVSACPPALPISP